MSIQLAAELSTATALLTAARTQRISCSKAAVCAMMGDEVIAGCGTMDPLLSVTVQHYLQDYNNTSLAPVTNLPRAWHFFRRRPRLALTSLSLCLTPHDTGPRDVRVRH